MEKLNDLRDLLKHEIQDLYSVEEQIIAAMPNMIEKATNPELKQSLKEHLRITEQQKARLDQVQQAFGEGNNQAEEGGGLLSRLFKTKMVCKGMQGIISEGNQILSADMNSDVMDAAIIACAQKIEHYEICGYGTAKAYARELNLPEVERLLEQTLNEEYDADDRLTALAVGRLNERAENTTAGKVTGNSASGTSRSSRSSSTGNSGNTRSTTQRVPQGEMEMEIASNKSGSTSRSSTSSTKGTSAPKGAAGGRTASGSTSTGAASKTAGSQSIAGTTGASGTSGKTAGSRTTGTGAGKGSATGSKAGTAGSRSGSSRTR